MAIKYLGGGRIQGTDSETRLKNLFANAFTGINKDSNSMVGAGAGGTKTDSPINGQNSLYFDPENKEVTNTNATTYIGGIGTTATTWKELPKSDFTVTMWVKAQSGTGYNQMAEGGYEGSNGVNASPEQYGDILGNGRPYGNESARIGNGFAIGIQKDGSEEFLIHLAGGGNSNQVGLNRYYTSGDACPHDNDWHFYAFTFSNTLNTSSGFKLYRDGADTPIDTENYAMNITANTNSANAFDIGRQAQGNGQLLRQAFVCDIGIWNKILTTAEQDLIFNDFDPTATTSSSNTGKNIGDSGVDTDSCLVWWKMGDHAGAGVTDGFSTSAVASTQTNMLENVPVGTRLEVTDTRKVFGRYYAGKFDSSQSWVEKGTVGYLTPDTTLNSSLVTGGMVSGGNSVYDTTETFSGGTWSASHDLLRDRYSHAGGGTSTSALTACGSKADGGWSNLSSTEKLVSGSWASDVAFAEQRYYCSGGGSRTNFLICHGNSGSDSPTYNRTHSWEFNGTSWHEDASIGWECYASNMGGNGTSAVCFGGNGGNPVTSYAVYDNTSWGSVGNMNQARYIHGGDGTSTNAIAYHGADGASNTNRTTETFDGTSWTDRGQSSLSAYSRYGAMACGTGTTAVMGMGKANGVYLNSTEIWDGTAFATTGNAVSAREYSAGGYA